MQLMKEGAKWELYIPSELGYGDRGAGGQIPGGAVLVFTLELLKVRGETEDAITLPWRVQMVMGLVVAISLMLTLRTVRYRR